ncbi:MAG: hypothetical protein LBL66_03265 [Clostridiales bacterium]|jgi:predicted secreted hydrolase|nr:hypothetical protein [Clostridiales bacterium]
MKKIKYDPDNLQSFEKEWGIHKKCKEWWYATGFLQDGDGNLYSYHYNVLRLHLGIVTPKLVMAAFTDFRGGNHHYMQRAALGNKNVVISGNEASYANLASAKRESDGFRIDLNHKDFKLSVKAKYGKGAFWHCDNGKLQMALPAKKETTLYYSYTNMPTEGTAVYGGRTLEVKGKTWFDKQGGSYSIMKRETNSEWFSLRFHDDEEMMLFAFPQSDYRDGTYITVDSKSERLTDYVLKTTKVIEKNGLKWSSGWDLYVSGKKEERYTITPILEGKMNFAYFEELCRVLNPKGAEVGLCFVELLPGVLNEGKINSKNLFEAVEY